MQEKTVHPNRAVNFGLPSRVNKFKLKKEIHTQNKKANETESYISCPAIICCVAPKISIQL
jgi:hypothetical protein